MERLIKGDKVRVIAGKNKGKEGTILSINRVNSCAIVEGVNMAKRHQKAKKEKNQDKGTIATMEAPIPLCKLAIVDTKSKTGISKVKFQITDQKKSRVTRKTNVSLSKANK
jgi:large subunit ribosomal protein L24